MEIQTNRTKIADTRQTWLEDYETLNPPPEHETSLFERFQWFVLLIFAIIVSANHTVSFLLGEAITDNQRIVAVSTMAMIELSLVKMSERFMKYLSIRYPDNMEKIRIGLLLMGMFLVGFVAVGANVLHQMHISGIDPAGWTKSVVVQVAGITAPIIAIIIGIMFTSMQNDNKMELKLWEKGRAKEWEKFKKRNYVGIKVSKPTDIQTDNTPRLSASMSNQTDNRQTGAGFSRASSAQDNARQWLLEHPNMAHKSVRELATLIPDAGKDSISKARNQLKHEGKL